MRHGSVKRVASAVGEGAVTIPLVHRCLEAMAVARPLRGGDPVDGNTVIKPLVPGVRWLLYTAAVLVLLAGFQLFVFTERTNTYFAWTIVNPLAAAFLGAGYWASFAIEALAATAADLGERAHRRTRPSSCSPCSRWSPRCCTWTSSISAAQSRPVPGWSPGPGSRSTSWSRC